MSTHTAGRFEINKYDEIKGKHNSFKVTEYHRNGSGKTEAYIQAIREATVEAGRKRIRPCLMTLATTVLALLPVLAASGRGADVMVPMAIPSFGGMLVVLLSVFVVPTLTCALAEYRLRHKSETPRSA